MNHHQYTGICIVHAHYEGVDDISIDDNDTRNNIIKNAINHNHHQYTEYDLNNNNLDIIIGHLSKSIENNADSTGEYNANGSASNACSGDDCGKYIDLNNTTIDNKIINDSDGITNNKIEHINKPSFNGQIKEVPDDIVKEFACDFNNFLPEKIRVYRGLGYIRTILNQQYVITCNHIMVKYAKYKGYCYGADDSSGEFDKTAIVFDMIVYKRIPEIDVVIMKITTVFETPLQDLIINDEICPLYDKSQANTIITGEYVPNNAMIAPINKEKSDDSLQNSGAAISIEMKKILINNDVALTFDILKSRYVHDLPLFNIPTINTNIVQTYAKENNLDINKEVLSFNTKRLFFSKALIAKFSGMSGSIVRINNKNMAMICTCAGDGLSLKALPLYLIDNIVVNAITQNIFNVLGIQIDTQPCDIEFQNVDMYAHCVVKQSCCYINGKKVYAFSENDIILEVDNKQFNKDKMLWSDILNLYVPLNTYMLIQSNFNPTLPIPIKVVKQPGNDIKVRIYNLSSIPYDDMYKIRSNVKEIHVWKKLIFMELSEELIIFYEKLGINIINGSLIDGQYAAYNEKVVILFNYKKNIFNQELSKALYTSIPYVCTNRHKNKSQDHYFYVVSAIGQKKINCVNDLKNALNAQNKQKVTIKLLNYTGIAKELKITIDE
jgi:hypothetical protein